MGCDWLGNIGLLVIWKSIGWFSQVNIGLLVLWLVIGQVTLDWLLYGNRLVGLVR